MCIGPTEAIMYITAHKVEKTDYETNTTSIGKPRAFAKAVILNNNNEVMPIGVTGELTIYDEEDSAKNIAKGYYQLEEQTNKKFIELKLPYKEKLVRAYKTGDMAKIDGNLDIEFYGRQDDFVKITGGYLVSVNEVETTIRRILNTDIEICVMPVNKELALFIGKNGKQDISEDEIKRLIKAEMTFYMVPKYILLLDKIPNNKNGKTDTKKLKELALEVANKKKEIVKPITKIQQQVYDVAFEFTKREFSIYDDFVEDLNFDSLNMTAFAVKINNKKVVIQDLYSYSNVNDLANMIESEEQETKDEEEIVIPNNTKEISLNTVFLTGATGFLGAHILNDLANNEETKKVYCLIRSRLNKTSKERFESTLKYYFSKEEIEKITAKVEIVNGDLRSENLGLFKDKYEEIFKSVNTIINSAANVKHIGKYNEFYSDNVETVDNIIGIAKKFGISIAHISTISINGFESKDEAVFTENTLNIKQSFKKNPYLISKYEAEKHLLKCMQKGEINAKICRVGNIMPRYSDGKFQGNSDENAFLLALKEIGNLNVRNENILNMPIIFTPVDLCSKAIVTVLKSKDTASISHIENDKVITIEKILEYTKTEKEFMNVDIDRYKEELSKHFNIGVEHIKEMLEFKSNKYDNTVTNRLLEKEQFLWETINEEYVKNINLIMNHEV